MGKIVRPKTAKKQKRIPGTFDPPNEEVQEAAESYVQLLHARMETQEEENVARRTLLEAMQQHDVMEAEVDGYKVLRVHLDEDKIKVQKIKEAVVIDND